MAFDFDRVIERRGTHSLKWTRYSRDVLPLWVADMDFQAPEPVCRALAAAIDHGVFGYEMPGRRLRERVAARMESLYGWKVSPEMVVATPGVVSGFNVAAQAVCEPGQGILIQPPVYHPFFEVPEHAGARTRLAPLTQVNKASRVGYRIDWSVFETAIHSGNTRTAMFLLCHPHNPTGQIYTPGDLKRMADICLRNGTVICSDEIHSELLLDGARHVPLAALGPEIASRTITLVSASKTFNIVGLFCGFAIIPDPKIRAAFRRAQERLTLHVNSLGLIAAETAFSGECEEWLRELRTVLTGNRDFIIAFVAREMKGVRVTMPQATYLAWLDFGDLIRNGGLGPDLYNFFLRRAKVALNPGVEFGPGGERFVRLNFACPRATLAEALQRMRTALQST